MVLHTSMHNEKRASYGAGTTFRIAMRLAMDTVLRGHATSNEVLQSRGWKLFFLFLGCFSVVIRVVDLSAGRG